MLLLFYTSELASVTTACAEFNKNGHHAHIILYCTILYHVY